MRICNKCGNEVYESTIDGYQYECDVCDESLYSFETHERNEKRVCDCSDYELVRELQDRGLANRINYWQDEDISAAFEERMGVVPTQEQIDAVWLRMGHWFTDYLTEQGWEFIYDNLED